MSELRMTKPQTEGKNFDPHPEGTFMAVCRDIYIKEDANPYFGKVSNFTGKVDEKQFVRRIYIDFLTDEPIEINGDMKPRFARFRANLSWHEDSNLRKIIKGWNPALGKDDNADLEALVGKGAYLTITHNIGKDGNTYSNIMGIAAPPKGATVPMVPADFVRYKDRRENGGDGKTTAAPAAHIVGDDEDSLSF